MSETTTLGPLQAARGPVLAWFGPSYFDAVQLRAYVLAWMEATDSGLRAAELRFGVPKTTVQGWRSEKRDATRPQAKTIRRVLQDLDRIRAELGWDPPTTDGEPWVPPRIRDAESSQTDPQIRDLGATDRKLGPSGQGEEPGSRRVGPGATRSKTRRAEQLPTDPNAGDGGQPDPSCSAEADMSTPSPHDGSRRALRRTPRRNLIEGANAPRAQGMGPGGPVHSVGSKGQPPAAVVGTEGAATRDYQRGGAVRWL